MMFEQCKIVIFNNIIFMKKTSKIFRKNAMEIFRKNMKFSGQIFRLTSLYTGVNVIYSFTNGIMYCMAYSDNFFWGGWGNTKRSREVDNLDISQTRFRDSFASTWLPLVKWRLN